MKFWTKIALLLVCISIPATFTLSQESTVNQKSEYLQRDDLDADYNAAIEKLHEAANKLDQLESALSVSLTNTQGQVDKLRPASCEFINQKLNWDGTQWVCSDDINEELEWFAKSGWSACSTSCGGGTSTRNIGCRMKIQGTEVGSQYCTNLATNSQPSSSQSCNTQPCAPVYTGTWTTGTWGTCTGTCGGNTGVQNRGVGCTGGTCNPATRPPYSQACTTAACAPACVPNAGDACRYSTPMNLRPFSKCGAGDCVGADPRNPSLNKCVNVGEGSRVSCNYDGTIQCDGTCKVLPYTPPYRPNKWATGTWSACSKSCDGGTRTRSVSCVAGWGHARPDSHCSGAKPATSEPCNTQACAASFRSCAAGSNSVGSWPTTPHGQTIYGTCKAGTTGTYQGTCNNGNASVTINTCKVAAPVMKGCPAGSSPSLGSWPATAHGRTIYGTCRSGTTGTLRGYCNNGTPSVTVNTCKAASKTWKYTRYTCSNGGLPRCSKTSGSCPTAGAKCYSIRSIGHSCGALGYTLYNHYECK